MKAVGVAAMKVSPSIDPVGNADFALAYSGHCADEATCGTASFGPKSMSIFPLWTNLSAAGINITDIPTVANLGHVIVRGHANIEPTSGTGPRAAAISLTVESPEVQMGERRIGWAVAYLSLVSV